MDGSYTPTRSNQYGLFEPPESQSTEFINKRETVVEPRKPRTRRRKVWFALVIGFVVIALAVAIPVGILVPRKNKNSATVAGDTGGKGDTTGGTNANTTAVPTGTVLKTGGDGSTIVTENGTSFIYSNSFGGYWVQDPEDPFNNDARPNSWTPPLNTSWRWGIDRIYGVNLGGLFVLEPFITPELFQRYPGTVDEFTLSQAMAADQAKGGLGQLEDHYATFITEDDIAEIAGAGLNFLRIPIAFWAIETWPGEPYFTRTSWKYFLRVLNWARKYGLRVCLDLHAVPGSQNGYNHSGKLGQVNFLAGNMGIANAERALYYIRILTEFISQPEYQNLVVAFGIINEALIDTIGKDAITSFYLQAHDMIRGITGKGEGHGPYIVLHDGFQSTTFWDGFLQGSDRVILDQHEYFSFAALPPDPIAAPGPDGLSGGKWPQLACNTWGPPVNQTRQGFGLVIGGEFAGSPNDCGLFLLGTQATATSPQCDEYNDWEHYNDTMREGVQNFIVASFDALGDWFFWTWKVGPSQAGRVETPLWSYQLGLRNGWIPKDPRIAQGKCVSLGASQDPFDGNYQPWQTGTPSSIPPESTTQFPWPPPTITSVTVPMTLLPTYTTTGSIITMPPATFSSAPSEKTATVDGWFNDNDKEGGVVSVAGCEYPNEYDGVFSVVPTAPCTGPTPVVTPPPT